MTDSTARLRWWPAAQTPSTMLSGVWSATPSAVRSRVSQMLWNITGSSMRRDQLSSPTNSGEPRPSQLMKDSTATMTRGVIAKRAKNTAAGSAQPKPGRPTCAAEDAAGRRRDPLRGPAAGGTLSVFVVMSRSSLGGEGLHGLDEAVRVELSVEELLDGLVHVRAGLLRVRLVPGELERRGVTDQVVLEARVLGVLRLVDELGGVGGGRQVADLQLRLDEVVGVHELEELGDGLGVLGLLHHRVVVVGVAGDVGRVTLAALDGREGAVAEALLREVRVVGELLGVVPGAHQLEAGLARGQQLDRAAVGVLDGVVVLAEGARVDELRDHAQGLLRVGALPRALVAVEGLLEQLGPGDAVEEVLEPHLRRPDVA